MRPPTIPVTPQTYRAAAPPLLPSAPLPAPNSVDADSNSSGSGLSNAADERNRRPNVASAAASSAPLSKKRPRYARAVGSRGSVAEAAAKGSESVRIRYPIPLEGGSMPLLKVGHMVEDAEPAADTALPDVVISADPIRSLSPAHRQAIDLTDTARLDEILSSLHVNRDEYLCSPDAEGSEPVSLAALTNMAPHLAPAHAQAQDASTSWLVFDEDHWDWDVLEVLFRPGEAAASIQNALQECRSTVAAALRTAQLGKMSASARTQSKSSAYAAAVAQAVSDAAQWIEGEISGASEGTDMYDLLRKCAVTKNAVMAVVNNTFDPQRRWEIKQLVRDGVHKQKMSPIEAGTAVAINQAQDLLHHPGLEHLVRLSSFASVSVLTWCYRAASDLLESHQDKQYARQHIKAAFLATDQGKIALVTLRNLGVSSADADQATEG